MQVYLDTDVLIVFLGCSKSIEPRFQPLKLHPIHSYEATRKLTDAAFELYNGGPVDDECLKNLAHQVLERLKRKGSLPSVWLKRPRVMKEARALLDHLLRKAGISLAPTPKIGEADCTPVVGSTLSRQDKSLLELARQCSSILTNDTGILDCCRQLGLHDKCFRDP